MFAALATFDRILSRPTRTQAAPQASAAIGSYMIYRNGKPFLAVNALRDYAVGLLDGFASQSDDCFELLQAS